MKYGEILIGDYLEAKGHNPHGDRNLDGQIRRGIVVAKTKAQKQIELHTGWCVHPELICNKCGTMKEEILRHVPVENVASIIKDSPGQ